MRRVIYFVLLLFAEFASASQGDVQLDKFAREGNLYEVKRLLDAGVDVNKINKYGSTALVGAAGGRSKSHTDVAIALIARGADINKIVVFGSTALNEACYWGNIETVRVLLDAKANINAEKTNGYTPLLSAASQGHFDIVDLLIKAGADLNRQTKIGGLTALHLASSAGYHEIVKLLLNSGAWSDVKSSRGETYKDVAGRTANLRTP